MNLLENNFYGDNIRWFVAKVVNNNDPDKLGRVQIQIRGVHSTNESDIPQAHLPWASTLLPTTEGGTSGIGKIPKLLPNALVFGFFMDGKTSQLPLVIGHLIQEESPSIQQQRTAALNALAPNLSKGANAGPDGYVINNTVKNLDANNPDSYSDIFDPRGDTTGSVADLRLAAMLFFIDNGYTVSQSAGIVGNLERESKFDSTVVSGVSGESSQGIAQWNPDSGRLQILKECALANGYNWRNFSVQLQFILHELDNYSYFKKDKLTKCTKFIGGFDDKNSTYIFMRWYLRPANQKEEISIREALAKKAYDSYNYNVSAGAG